MIQSTVEPEKDISQKVKNLSKNKNFSQNKRNNAANMNISR